jgi:glucosamine-6-phosphate deaminase
MKVLITSNYQAMSLAAYRIYAAYFGQSSRAVVIHATGGTPELLYAMATAAAAHHLLDYSQVTSFNLDEYVGLPKEHPQSYWTFMWEHLFEHLQIRPQALWVPDGMAPDLDQYCRMYEEALRQAAPQGADLCLLGIGPEGHLAFNERGSTEDSRTRVVALAQSTVDANARFFASRDEVPLRAISMGIATILESKRLLLMANGAKKAAAIAAALEGPVTPNCPASFVQRHGNVTVVLDKAAASKLTKSYA